MTFEQTHCSFVFIGGKRCSDLSPARFVAGFFDSDIMWDSVGNMQPTGIRAGGAGTKPRLSGMLVLSS